MIGRIAVGVSGTGTNLRALVAAIGRGSLAADIALVFADRPCPALDWAAQQGIETALLPAVPDGHVNAREAEDEALAQTLTAVGPDLVVLAGYMRIVGPRTLAAFAGRIVNTHPSLLPAFPGARPVRDALAAGVAVTGATVHLVDERLDGGPILAQEPVTVLAGDDEAALHERIKAVEHRILPTAVGLLLAGALRAHPPGAAVVDAVLAEATLPRTRRALLATWDKTGLPAFAAELARFGFELVSTGGTAADLRGAGLEVTDVAAVTGVAEMLDGRVKTLHPGIHGGILADTRRPDHRRQLLEAWIAPFEIVVVNLYPFEAAAERSGIDLDGLIEEIDIGGPTLLRAAAKNHASVAVVSSPARYPEVLASLRAHGNVVPGLRAALAVEAFRQRPRTTPGSRRSCRRAWPAPGSALPDEAGLPGASDPYPRPRHRRSRRSRRCGTARTRTRPGRATGRRPRGRRTARSRGCTAAAGQAAQLQQRPRRRRRRRVARGLDGPGASSSSTPTRAAPPRRHVGRGVAGGAGRGSGVRLRGRGRLTRPVDRQVEPLTSMFLEVVVAPGLRAGGPGGLRRQAEPPARRAPARPPSASAIRRRLAARHLGALRTAGGAVLVAPLTT